MAGRIALPARRIFVIDTSYLDELFAVPGYSCEEGIAEVRIRFQSAVERSDGLFVPLPCLFELGNHIAHVTDGAQRQKLANFLVKTVERSIAEQKPWTITPAEAVEYLPEFMRDFEKNFVPSCVGLTDTFVVHEAKRLKRRENKVHIWTKDVALKAYEPDAEENSYVGSGRNIVR